MQFAKGTFAAALILFAGGAIGLLGSWGLVTGAVALLVSACVGAVGMEARDYADQRSFGLATATAEPEASADLPPIAEAA